MIVRFISTSAAPKARFTTSAMRVRMASSAAVPSMLTASRPRWIVIWKAGGKST